MAKSKNRRGRPRDPQSKRSRGVERNLGPRESFHMDEALHDAFLAFLKQSDPPGNKSATLRRALKEYLVKHGAWQEEE